ncbi:MAG: class I SAM-dependent methyltransferase [Saprospiraceae bacterium]|nr:class I SAM-dependent methyltransferase [Saprospiraceae bacterium]
MMHLEEKENIEISYWRDSPTESPEKFTKGNLMNKMQECRQFDYKLRKFRSLIKGRAHILELGAGQGWASCFMKKFYRPSAHFTVTDISPFAIESLPNWEKIFDVKMTNALACKSYDVPLRDASFDMIFCYAAAHHFIKIKETLEECKRLLKEDGIVLFLYEPTASSLFYPLHYKYVNTAPHVTPEDVLVPGKIQKIANEIGLEYVNHFDPHQEINRSLFTMLYFKVLKVMPFLQRLLPSSSDLVFKPTV